MYLPFTSFTLSQMQNINEFIDKKHKEVHVG